MSNEVYDEFCKASIPDLTTLDRQLLGHYCARYNEEKNPPRAWPSRAELMRITGVCDKSISRSLGRLTKSRIMFRVTLANKDRGLKAEYAINRPLLRSYIQVTEELPNTPLKVTERVLQGNSVELVSNSPVPLKVLSGYAKRIKPIQPKNVDTDRFNTLRPLLRDELRQLQGGKNYESALDILESKGATVEEVARHINSQNFANSQNLGGLVASMLKSYAHSYTSVKPIVKPAWCGLCESPESRIEAFAYEIRSNPPGARSRVCRACG